VIRVLSKDCFSTAVPHTHPFNHNVAFSPITPGTDDILANTGLSDRHGTPSSCERERDVELQEEREQYLNHLQAVNHRRTGLFMVQNVLNAGDFASDMRWLRCDMCPGLVCMCPYKV
jgi:hypothetical protein